MPLEGELILELPTMPVSLSGVPSYSTDGIAYTNKDKKYASGVLGTESIDPSLVSYYDYQFLYPTQVLLRVVPKGDPVSPVPFPTGMPLNAQTSYVDLANVKANVNREFLIVKYITRFYHVHY